MSTTRESDVGASIDGCRRADATPVALEAAALESTAPADLRALKSELDAADLVPAELSVETAFEEDCSLSTQREADRLREYVYAASFLGAGTLTVSVGEVADAGKVEPALSACAERAEREGVSFEVEGPVSVE